MCFFLTRQKTSDMYTVLSLSLAPRDPRTKPAQRTPGAGWHGAHTYWPSRALVPRFRTMHVSLSNFWVPIQSLCKGGDYGTLVPS